jgi:3-deoxy-D-manno-octulosonic-acid transferase
MLIYLPFLVYDVCIRKKYQHSLFYRLGLKIPVIDNQGRETIWIHAVSLGETKAVATIVEKIRESKPNCYIIFSSITETGHEEAKKSMPFADKHIYLPIDAHFFMKKLMKSARPKLLLISETDFWFQFQRQARKYGANIVLVNGKLSERSLARYQKFSFFSKALLRSIDLFCLQGDIYQKRFMQLGVPKEKIQITGNTKLDQKFSVMKESEVTEWKKHLGIEEGQEVLVFGSTHEIEEDLALKICKKIWEIKPSLKVLLVPRHPERFPKVAQLIKDQDEPFTTFTEITENVSKERLILIDGMGILQRCYQVATIAVVCGSFTEKVGGHNIFEPLHFAVPAIFGPHMFTQQGAKELVLSQEAGLQVNEESLEGAIVKLLEDSTYYQNMSQNALALIEEAKGASDKTLSLMRPFLGLGE